MLLFKGFNYHEEIITLNAYTECKKENCLTHCRKGSPNKTNKTI